MRRDAPVSANLLQFLGANVNPVVFFEKAADNPFIFCTNGLIHSLISNYMTKIIYRHPFPAREKNGCFRGLKAARR